MVKYDKETDTVTIPANMLPVFSLAAEVACSAVKHEYKSTSVFNIKKRHELKTFIDSMQMLAASLNVMDTYCKGKKNA